MHRILERQIRHYLSDHTADTPELRPLFDAISKTYTDFDEGQLLLDRSLELSSKEFQEINRRLRVAKEEVEQKIKEQAEGAEKYETLVNNLSVGVYRNTPGPKGHFLEANPAIVAMFEAASKEDFLKHNVSDLYQNPVGRSLFAAKLLKNGSVHNEELNLVTLQGKPIIASVSAVVKKDKNGVWRIAGSSGWCLVVIGTGKTVERAREKAYKEIKNISIPNMFYRGDIGSRWSREGKKLRAWDYI